MYANDAGALSTLAKRWSATLLDGRAICAYIGVDGGLYVSAARDLKAHLTNAQSGKFWPAPIKVPVTSDGTSGGTPFTPTEVAVGIHPGVGRGHLWYSRKNAAGAQTNVYATSPTCGASPDWTAPKVISTTPGAAFTQPYTLGVLSQSSGLGGGTRMGETFLGGSDGRLYCYGDGTPLVCMDGGIGDKWSQVSPGSVGPYNSYDGSPRNTGLFDTRADPGGFDAGSLQLTQQYAGKSYGGMVQGAVKVSALVESADGSLYQLVWANQYSRRAKVYPRPGTSTVNSQQINNTTANYTPGGDFAGYSPTSGAAVSLNYRMDVPSGASIPWVTIYFQNVQFERPPIKGKLNDSKRPAKITFAVPELRDVPPYDPHGGSSGYSYFQSASVLVNFTFRDAENLVVHVGQKFVPADPLTPGSVASGDQLPSRIAPYVFCGCAQAIAGRGEFGFQPNPPPVFETRLAIPLTYERVVQLDQTRQTNVTLDLELFYATPGNAVSAPASVIEQSKAAVVGEMAWKDCYLILGTGSAPVVTPSAFEMASGMAGSMSPRLGLGLDGQQNTPEMGALLNYTYGRTGMAPLLDEINAQRGSTWDFDLVYTPGRDAAGYYTPFDYVGTDAYAVLNYPVDPADLNACDFFLIRSRDCGRSWEFANNAKPIAGLASLRDANRVGAAHFLMPSLLSEDNIVYVVWVDGAIKTLATQDAGETWSSAT